MKCPACRKKMKSYYQTVFNCENRDCIMFHAILGKEQWEYLIANIKWQTHKETPNVRP